jgi:hypothetical protein
MIDLRAGFHCIMNRQLKSVVKAVPTDKIWELFFQFCAKSPTSIASRQGIIGFSVMPSRNIARGTFSTPRASINSTISLQQENIVG